MLSLSALKKSDPDLAPLTDEEIEQVRESFYAFGELIFEQWCKDKLGSKNPAGDNIPQARMYGMRFR